MRSKDVYRVSLETLMKWIFLLLALSMVLLMLGARLHQSYSDSFPPPNPPSG
ncbi:MAG: hypothetical protein ACLUEQ_02815 [Cloacibacillus evryensis]